jgi:uncharacterized protein
VSHSIVIGTGQADSDVRIDIEELLATRLLVQGNSGSGKSHLLRRLLEESARLVQQVVIDPEGDFVTLADEYGHVVIDAGAYDTAEIAALAARIRQHRASVVLALDGLELEAQMRCAALFLNTLFDAPREQWFPAMVIVDEAQMFAPSGGSDVTEETRRVSLAAMTNLMCRGRKRGLAGVIATQRLAKLAKNVAAEASNFLMGRTFLDIDMQRAADLLGMERRQAERIRDLERGEFLALGPAISRRPVPVRIGGTQTGPRSAVGGLIPLPDAPAQDMFALLHADLAEEASAAPAPPVPEAQARAEDLYERIAETRHDAPLVEEDDSAADLPPRPEAGPVIDGILADLAGDPETPFRAPASVYQDFTVRCRMERLPGDVLDLAAFRRRLSMALAGFGPDREPAEDDAALLALARRVPDDWLAPFLLIGRAAIDERPCPSDEELAQAYGTRSPGRIRRLIEHLEKQDLIVSRADFGGRRSIGIPGLSRTTAPAEA